jgi:hypothetical protein
MEIEIRKAERVKSKLRLGLAGPSGSGKTMSALKVAKGIGGPVCLIDTERGSGDLYANLYDYSVITLEPPFKPDILIDAIHAAEKAGFAVIIIDSLSHFWSDEGGILDQADKMQNSGKNRFTLWADPTAQRRTSSTTLSWMTISRFLAICSGQSTSTISTRSIRNSNPAPCIHSRMPSPQPSKTSIRFRSSKQPRSSASSLLASTERSRAMNAVLRWPVELKCEKCNCDDDVLISELSVERIGLLFVQAFCGTCKHAFAAKLSMARLCTDAEDQDNLIDQPLPEIAGTWTAHPKPSKPN